MGLFDRQPTVTLYDLTNTYFEGEASEQPQAKRGHSKEKRSDCPLLTLGLMFSTPAASCARSKVFDRQRHANSVTLADKCSKRWRRHPAPSCVMRPRRRHRVPAMQCVA